MSYAQNHRVLEELRDRIAHLERGQVRKASVLPFGVAEIDERLPGGGIAYGALHEIAGGGSGTIDGAAEDMTASAADVIEAGPEAPLVVPTATSIEPPLGRSLGQRQACKRISPQRASRVKPEFSPAKLPACRAATR